MLPLSNISIRRITVMSEEEKLKVYLDRLQKLCIEKIQDQKISAMQALKESLNIIEGEMTGY